MWHTCDFEMFKLCQTNCKLYLWKKKYSSLLCFNQKNCNGTESFESNIHLNRTFWKKKKKSSISFIQKNLFIHLTVWFVHVLRLASKTCATALMQAGFQTNQFASIIDRTDKITNFTKNHASKSFFFFRRLKRDFPLNFCICHKKSKIMNWKKKNNLLVLFIHKIHVILFSKVLKTFKFKLFSSF